MFRHWLILNWTFVFQEQMKLEADRIFVLFRKVMTKLTDYLYEISSEEIKTAAPRLKEVSWLMIRLIVLSPGLADRLRKIWSEKLHWELRKVVWVVTSGSVSLFSQNQWLSQSHKPDRYLENCGLIVSIGKSIESLYLESRFVAFFLFEMLWSLITFQHPYWDFLKLLSASIWTSQYLFGWGSEWWCRASWGELFTLWPLFLFLIFFPQALSLSIPNQIHWWDAICRREWKRRWKDC